MTSGRKFGFTGTYSSRYGIEDRFALYSTFKNMNTKGLHYTNKDQETLDKNRRNRKKKNKISKLSRKRNR